MPIDPGDISICLADPTAAIPPGGAPTSTPIVMTSLFHFPDFDGLLDGFASEDTTHVYTRGQNPTIEAVEKKLAALERGEACKCFGSGMAAISAVLFGVLEAGDHVLFVNQTYGPTLQLAESLRRFGVSHDLVVDLEIDAIARMITPATRLVWLESPSTMLMRVLDVPAVAALAQSRGILTCIDNSWATPLFQKPLTMGVDIVVHTCSKYLNGHSDLMAGAVISTAARIREIFYRSFMLLGGILGPQEAWLLLRGMRTLPARLRQHEIDGLQVAEALRSHPAVAHVYHPAFADDIGLVSRQLTGYSGLFSFTLRRDDFASVRTVINALKHFRIGVSWGGVESIVISPMNPTRRVHAVAQQIPDGLIRVSIGLEGADVLLDDLTSALATVS